MNIKLLKTNAPKVYQLWASRRASRIRARLDKLRILYKNGDKSVVEEAKQLKVELKEL